MADRNQSGTGYDDEQDSRREKSARDESAPRSGLRSQGYGTQTSGGTQSGRANYEAVEDITPGAPAVKDKDTSMHAARPGDPLDSRDDASSTEGRPTERSGPGTTSSHTGGGTHSADTATGASGGASYGGATTRLSDESSATQDERGNAPSGGPGSARGLAGQSTSSSSTTKPPRS